MPNSLLIIVARASRVPAFLRLRRGMLPWDCLCVPSLLNSEGCGAEWERPPLPPCLVLTAAGPPLSFCASAPKHRAAGKVLGVQRAFRNPLPGPLPVGCSKRLQCDSAGQRQTLTRPKRKAKQSKAQLGPSSEFQAENPPRQTRLFPKGNGWD